MSELIYRCSMPQGKKHPQWSYNAVIYELNTRQFTPEGTFKAAGGHLERLRDLGVDIIWLMPVHPIGMERRKGTLGSYYSVRDYLDINPEFGSKEDFRALVDGIHKLGMKVIIDWVPNHTSRDAVWTTAHPEWYEHDPATGEIATPFDWTDTAKLDYSNADMRAAMREAMKFWLSEYGIDGFRVDMAMLVPTSFWNETTPILEAAQPELFMLAEAEETDLHERAFDATYGWELHHIMNDLASGKCNADLLRYKLMELSIKFPPHAFHMNFTSNHDENTWNRCEYFRMGEATTQMAVLSFVIPGIPLIYNGQEIGSQKILPFFEKDNIDWNEHSQFQTLYQELCRLKHEHPALQSGEKGGDLYTIDNNDPSSIFSVKRKVGDDILIALFNFSDRDIDVEFSDPDFNGVYRQLGSDTDALLKSSSRFFMRAWGYFVYYMERDPVQAIKKGD